MLIVVLSMPLFVLGMWASGPLTALAEGAIHLLARDPKAANGWAVAVTVLPLITAFAIAAGTGCYVAVRFGGVRSSYGAPLVGVLGGILLASLAVVAQGPFTSALLWATVYTVLIVTGGLSGLVVARFARHTSGASMKGASARVLTASRGATKSHEPH